VRWLFNIIIVLIYAKTKGEKSVSSNARLMIHRNTMARSIKILSSQEIRVFESPPVFNNEQRKKIFSLNKLLLNQLELYKTPETKVGFVLQQGYFKAVNRFFPVKKFHKSDIEFIARRLNISITKLNMNQYLKSSMGRHQETILQTLGYSKFNTSMKEQLKTEASLLMSRQIKTRLIFMSLVDYLRIKKIQVPGYNVIAEIITETLKSFENTLINIVSQTLKVEEAELLDSLLEKDTPNDEEPSNYSRYTITLLKKHSHSIRAGDIKENIQDYEFLELLFEHVKPIVTRLNLTTEIIKYYADIVFRSQVFQISRRDEKRYLYLLSFIVDNLYELNDMLVVKLNKSIQQALNYGNSEHEKSLFEDRITRAEAMKNISKEYKSKKETMKLLKKIMFDNNSSYEQKVSSSIDILKSFEENEKVDEHLLIIDREVSRIIKNADYYDILEGKSRSLQTKISPIIHHFNFDENTSNPTLLNAIFYFKNKKGRIDDKAPLDIFEDKELDVLYNDDGKLRVSLYKILLFVKISHGIKSGALNIHYSYEYRAFEEYLIDLKSWNEQRANYISRSGLENVENFLELDKNLRKRLKHQYKVTNLNIENNSNKYIKVDKEGNLSLTKYETESPEEIINLFPQNTYISIFELLASVDRMTDFLSSFSHLERKYSKNTPKDNTLFAGIIGYGCNLGIRKISQISKDINVNKLVNTTKWRFSISNLHEANNEVLKLIGDFKLSKIFKKVKNRTHTSNDGSKRGISVESINANKSFKYFGMKDGIVINSFIDESHRLFYSTVISPAERESAYVIDGLLHNEVVKSDIHSTDTHGYNEIIFAITHLLGISFAPRIANFKKQYLYSFDYVANVKKLGYKIVPDRKINTKIIEENWNNILRLITTLKTKKVTASQLFKRLSSYSRQHPLYRAIKEFGKIIKTLFLLKYIDDVELRKDIQKMLNKIESSHRFGRAVSYSDSKELKYANKNEQLVAEGCKRLIENSIICWNYAYLTDMIANAPSEEARKELIGTIQNKSVVAWGHINFQGTYDFSESALSNKFNFNLKKLLDVSIEL